MQTPYTRETIKLGPLPLRARAALLLSNDILFRTALRLSAALLSLALAALAWRLGLAYVIIVVAAVVLAMMERR